MTVDSSSRGDAPALDALDRALHGVEIATAVIAGVVIFFIMWLGVAEILLRKLFNNPLYGQLDLVEQTMAAYTLLTISYCYRKAGHIRVDILVRRFTGRAHWIAEFAVSLAALAFIVAIMPGILHFFQNAYYIGDSTINTQWPTWPSKLVPVIGFAILVARLVLELWAYGRLIADPGTQPIAVPIAAHVVDDV